MADDGVTVIEFVVAPVLHENRIPPLAVSVMLAPLQIETLAGVIDAAGLERMLTMRDAVAEQEPPSVTVTE